MIVKFECGKMNIFKYSEPLRAMDSSNCKLPGLKLPSQFIIKNNQAWHKAYIQVLKMQLQDNTKNNLLAFSMLNNISLNNQA